MLSAFKLPLSLKLTEIKALATACGVPISGTKAELAHRLETSIYNLTHNSGIPPPDQRVLSIDMGIRNLAFSLLSPPCQNLTPASEGIRTPLAGVAVSSWKRVELTGPAIDVKSAAEGDPWTPENMAEMTLRLVEDRLLSFDKPPTHILIERQRFRSGGGAAVQEWTLRVNTLEAMIYSTLRTMKECGRWQGEVIPITPKRVGPFWLEGMVDSDTTDATSKNPESRKEAKARHKKEKIDLVGKWLQEGKIEPVDQAKDMATSYHIRWQGKRAKKASTEDGGPAGEHLKKLDDLADCLLQGMAWIKWQDNKKLLAHHGPEALLKSRPS